MLHVLVLGHLGVIFMPLLYFCFGALLDILIFIALYAWVASVATPQATLPRGVRA